MPDNDSRPHSSRPRLRPLALCALVASWILLGAIPVHAHTFDVSLTADLEDLAGTGWDPMPLLALAVVLLVSGISLLALSRRRPASRPAE